MIVIGTYENGRIELPESVRLKHTRVEVKVDIPDEEIVERESPDAADPVDALMRDLDAIRGGAGSLPDDGMTDRDKFARAISRESKYRG